MKGGVDAQGGRALAVLPNDEDLIVLERQVPVPALGLCLGPHQLYSWWACARCP